MYLAIILRLKFTKKSHYCKEQVQSLSDGFDSLIEPESFVMGCGCVKGVGDEKVLWRMKPADDFRLRETVCRQREYLLLIEPGGSQHVSQ
ncbi:MAG: hypothetical protein A2Y91_05145 [Chloroflexi bacterium RBG_13_54_8]|nr:MAG: hypothetical protein A2Y91_05145 [Chloroflexi bacterium RBG_13_54_8]